MKRFFGLWLTLLIFLSGPVLEGKVRFGDFTIAAESEMVTVYRGVHAEHPALAEALQGRAAPIGGHADAALHNAFDNRSIFTSWTTDQATAVRFATENGPGGVLLRQSVPRSTLLNSPDIFKEFEVLRVGPVNNDTPIILSK